MPAILSKIDVTRSWEALHAQNGGLPRVLRDPQRDAMFWLSQGKHVVLCVGTGETLLVANTEFRLSSHNSSGQLVIIEEGKCLPHKTRSVLASEKVEPGPTSSLLVVFLKRHETQTF